MLCLSLMVGTAMRAADQEGGPDRILLEGERMMLFVDVGNGSPPFTYQWNKNDAPIPGATSSMLVFASIQAGDAGAYTVTVANSAGATTSDPEIVAVKTVIRSHVANVSIQAVNGDSLIAGFAVGGGNGSGPAQLLVRAAGPSLAQFGIGGTLPDPALGVFNGARLLVANDDWESDTLVPQAARAVGAFPFLPGSRDAAIVLSLDPGSYTARVTDSSGATGTTLVELYDLTPSNVAGRPRLVNVSARGTVRAATPLVAGFTVNGETSVTLLLRGVGPALTSLGISDALNDPRLRLFRGATLVSSNDNWTEASSLSLAETAGQVGAFALPAKSLDSAVLVTLPPGSYTAQLESTDSTSGVALMEIYEVPQ